MRLKYLNSLKCQNIYIYLINCIKCANRNDTLPTTTTSNKSNKQLSLRVKMRLCYLAFFYNESTDSYQTIDTMLQP